MRSEWMLIWMLSSSRWMTELERGFDELMIAEGPDLRSEDVSSTIRATQPHPPGHRTGPTGPSVEG